MKKINSLIASIFCSFLIFAQSVDYLHEGDAISSDICLDNFNNLYSVGAFNTNGPITFAGQTYNSNGNVDVLVQKRDANNNEVWAFQIGNATAVRSRNVNYDGLGAVWVSGAFYGTLNVGSFTLTAASSKDVFLIKLDAATGDVLFATSMGGADNDEDIDLKIDDLGNVYLSITYQNTFSYLGNTILSTTAYGTVVFKYANNGTLDQFITYGGTHWSMAVDDQYNVLIAGLVGEATVDFNGTSQPFTYPQGVYNYHVFAKFDLNGNYLWHTSCSAGGEIVGVDNDNQGNFYFVGNTGGTSTFGNITLTGNGTFDDILLGKLDPNGNFVWVKNWGGTSWDNGYAVEVDANGEVFVGARYQGIVDLEVANVDGQNSSKALVFKTDTDGNILWVMPASGATSSWVGGLTISNGNIYASGPVYADITFAQESFNSGKDFLLKITDGANIIKGKVFNDLNADGLLDLPETGIPNVMVQLNNTNYVSSTYTDGNYYLYVNNGNYDVSIPFPPLYYNLTTATTQNTVFTTLGSVDTSNNFGFIAQPNMNDLFVDITPVTNPKAGFAMVYQITYKNVGTTDLMADLSFTADQNLTFSNSSTTPNSTSGNTFNYQLGLLPAQSQGNITVTFQIPTSMNIGDILTSSASVSSAAVVDETPLNNIDTASIAVVGPYDPNYKKVDLTTVYNLTGSGYLEYEIHFQNLGNAPAQNVLVIDTLVDYLVKASAQVIATSHSPMNVSIENGNLAKFYFPGIQLPDSLTDPIGSCGFVKFRIMHDGTLPVDETIDNFGDIYFDYEDAIRTDTAQTIHLEAFAGITEEESSIQMFAYPVPVKDILTVTFGKVIQKETTLKIFDVNGAVVYQSTVKAGEEKVILDMSSLQKGTYMLKFGDDFQPKRIIK